jgi:hypothetical protein
MPQKGRCTRGQVSLSTEDFKKNVEGDLVDEEAIPH